MPSRPTQPSRESSTPRPGSEALSELPISVWTTAQQVAKAQRADRYTAETVAHPAKMLPAVARHAIRTYTAPGELVADPMCGIGTTLVEALHAGRRALGIEYEPRWARIARDNLALAYGRGATVPAEVVCDDARRAAAELTVTHRATIGLLLTSPPYGSSVHGLVNSVPGRGVHKRDYRYSRDRDNLAHQDLTSLLDGFTEILRGCVPLLTPGGVVVITTRPIRHAGELIDFPSLTLDAAINAGLQPVQRCIALLAGIRDGELVSRASFFHMHNIRQLREQGLPASVAAHEDVLVLRMPSVRPAGTAVQPRALATAGVP